MYADRAAFRLLLCRADGTRYEHFADRLAAIEESAYHVVLTNPTLHTDGAAEPEVDSSGPGLSPADRLFLHTLASAGVEALRAALAQDLSHAEARRYMQRVKTFRLHGWVGLMRTMKGTQS